MTAPLDPNRLRCTCLPYEAGGDGPEIDCPEHGLDRPTLHELKTWPSYFAAIDNRTKTFEVRLDDRGFRQGDRLLLREYDPATDSYSGREATATIGYVLRGSCAAIPDFGNHVVFSLLDVWTPEVPF